MVALGIASLLLSQGQVDQVTSAYQFKFIVGTVLERGLPASRFGLSEDEMIRREDCIWRLVLEPAMDFVPTNVQQLEGHLKTLGASVCLNSDSEVCRNYFVCLAIGAWVKSHVASPLGGNREMSGLNSEGSPVLWESGKAFNLSGMLSCTKLEGFCRHDTVLARKMIIDVLPTVKAWYVSGWSKPFGGESQSREKYPNHGWDMVDLGDGLSILMDCTGTSRAVNIYRELYSNFRRSPDPINMIPRRPDELEIFLASHYGGSTDKSWSDADASGQAKKLSGSARPPWQDHFMPMSVDQWWSMDTSGVAQLRKAVLASWRRR